jgi:hypothetical protein
MHFPNFDVDKRYGHWSKISPLGKQFLGRRSIRRSLYAHIVLRRTDLAKGRFLGHRVNGNEVVTDFGLVVHMYIPVKERK